MIKTPRLRERAQSRGEEIANSISHGVGLLAVAVAVPVLFVSVLHSGGLKRIIACSVYAATIVLMYLCSTIYHALPRNRAKYVFRVFDHSAIFLLIAGTYTPLALGVLHGALGWTLLGLVWGMAVVGVVLTAISRVRYPTVSTAVYLAMGWLIVVAAKPLWDRMEPWGLFWLMAGGLAYTGGVAFFAADRVRYGHLVWHACVIAGSACHFVMVLRYSA